MTHSLWRVDGYTWNSFNNEGFAKGLNMADALSKVLEYEHPLIERGAIAEFDCTYCPAVKGGSCFVVLSGIKGSRLPDFAHIARRMLWVDKHGPLTQEQKDDYELEEMMKPAPWPLCREPGWLDEERGIRVATSPCYLCANNLPHPKPPPKVKKVVIQSTPPKPKSDDWMEKMFLASKDDLGDLLGDAYAELVTKGSVTVGIDLGAEPSKSVFYRPGVGVSEDIEDLF